MMTRLRRLWTWLTERTESPESSRRLGPDDLVELTRLSNRFEADAVAANLRSARIRCFVYYADASGWHPQLGLVQGNRIMVRAEDVARARDITGDH